MDYLNSQPKAIFCFHASDMVLSLMSDAAYLVLPDSISHSATTQTLSNGQVHVLVKTI